jgi:hypothetical protein
MFQDSDILHELQRIQRKRIIAGESIVQEANKILNQDLFSDKKILENLGHYNNLSHGLDEDALDHTRIFSVEEIKHICTTHRLKFLGSKNYKPEIPYQSVMMIKNLNKDFTKELKEFKLLAPAETFVNKDEPGDSMLFATTNDGNFYLINRWGRPLKWYRKILFWPMRQFENLFITVALVTLAITLLLPTWLITLDHKAEYWSGYRAAAFFHILIFNLGVTAYVTFAFAKNFSSTVWNREQDFG